MFTIKENKIYEYEIKKSRFISILIKIKDKNEIESHLEEIRKKYKDATHYCYGYYLENDYHFSDDGEPGGTAGLPIIQVLKNNNLTNVLCVVIRYFGGIKLGSGGLVRAYTKAVVELLKECEIVQLVDGYVVKIITSYDKVKSLDNILKNKIIINRSFNDNIYYVVKIEKADLSLISNYNYEILSEEKIEKVE